MDLLSNCLYFSLQNDMFSGTQIEQESAKDNSMPRQCYWNQIGVDNSFYLQLFSFYAE